MKPLLCSDCREPSDRTGQRRCRACHNQYLKAWRAARRQAALAPPEVSYPTSGMLWHIWKELA